MSDITGTDIGETLTGTADPDTITALGGNDTVNAGAGNDTIRGGAGNDTLNGEDGDDLFIEDQFTVPLDIFNGGAGTDTIELRAAAVPLITSFGLLTPHTLSATNQMTSIERIVFASTAGQVVQASLANATWAASGITQIVGGAGRDFLTIAVGNAPGTYTMPVLPLSGWDAVSINAWEHTGDFVALSSAAPNTASVTMNALAGATFLQVISGGQGNDVLNGSANADWLDARAGGDQVNAGDGNDSILIINTANPTGSSWLAPTTFTGAGGTWNGGAGTDVISIGGLVNLQATLTSIEGVQLLPSVNPPTPIVARQDPAWLTLDSAHIAMLPANAFFTGTGTVEFLLNDATSFNGAGYSITAGSTIDFQIYAGAGDALTFSGNSGNDFIVLSSGVQSASGGAGNDIIQFGIGSQQATGGAGIDKFRPGAVAGVVTDFVVGEDFIDMSDTGISSMSRFNDLSFVDVAGSATLSADSEGIHFEMKLQGISAASISASNILLFSGEGAQNNTGTEFSDLMHGYAFNDVMHGAGGNDRIYGGGGIDQLFGEDGDDTIILDGAINFGGIYDGGAGTDTLLLRANATTVASPNGPQSTYNLLTTAPGTGLTAIERLQFDTAAGTAMLAVTNIAATPSEVIGGAGSDALVAFAGTAGTYSLSGLTLTNWNGVAGGDALVLFVNAGNTISVTFNARSDIGNQVLISADGIDTLNGSSFADTFQAGGGADTLNGNGGADIFKGEAGNDRIAVGTGSDGSSVDGGADTDTLAVSGTVGSLAALVSIEAVALTGGASLTLTGAQFRTGLAANTAFSGTGGVTVNMGVADLELGANTMSVIPDSTITLTINGSSSIEIIKGLAGAVNTINGGDGGDQIRGGAQADLIFGDLGNDKLAGGQGADQLTGGAGSDQFRFQSAASSGLGAAADRVADFVVGSDLLVFRQIDTDPLTIGDQAFAFIGSNAFGASGAAQMRYANSGADLLVQADINGDGVADMEVLLLGLAGQTLTGSDFLL